MKVRDKSQAHYYHAIFSLRISTELDQKSSQEHLFLKATSKGECCAPWLRWLQPRPELLVWFLVPFLTPAFYQCSHWEAAVMLCSWQIWTEFQVLGWSLVFSTDHWGNVEKNQQMQVYSLNLSPSPSLPPNLPFSPSLPFHFTLSNKQFSIP